MSAQASIDVGIVGVGATGSRIARRLLTADVGTIGVFDRRDSVTEALRRSTGNRVVQRSLDDVLSAPVVVLACGGDQPDLAARVLRRAGSCVTTSDRVADVNELLALGPLAASVGRALVVGAALMPGMSGLMARMLVNQLDSADEIHVAVHGTGGPDCARQHHRALAGTALGWHDDEWLERPAGSGRELCWFPDPVGPRDCYRAEVPEPVVLQRIFPTVDRISARMSATRRDRLTARLPMLSPPHAEGGVGGLRVEVRGTNNGERCALVLGVAERPAVAAGVVAGVVASSLAAQQWQPTGAVLLGQPDMPNQRLLDAIRLGGVAVHEFVGPST